MEAFESEAIANVEDDLPPQRVEGWMQVLGEWRDWFAFKTGKQRIYVAQVGLLSRFCGAELWSSGFVARAAANYLFRGGGILLVTLTAQVQICQHSWHRPIVRCIRLPHA